MLETLTPNYKVTDKFSFLIMYYDLRVQSRTKAEYSTFYNERKVLKINEVVIQSRRIKTCEINTYLPWVSEGMIHKPQNIFTDYF